jgi:hypothetical protein
LPDDSANDLYLTFTDMAGRIIINVILPDVQGYASLTKLDGLARGVYLVKIRYGSLVDEIKVVK